MLTAASIKKHLVVDHCDDDDLIKIYWDGAIEFCEGRISGPIVLKQRVKNFEGLYDLRLGDRVTEVIEITYTDETGAKQILPPDDYMLVWTAHGWYVMAATAWPVSFGTVTVTYIAGFGVVPADLNDAILMMIGHFYANREAVSPVTLTEVPLAVDALLDRHKRYFA